MQCPFCKFNDSKVIDSRSADEGTMIRRRRECISCQRRFTTYEALEAMPLIVLKKNGERERFERQKLMSGILRSCEKRSIPLEDISKLVDELERELRDHSDGEIPSTEIGELVMAKLQNLDQVAYVRFASVYRQFADVSSFLEALHTMVTPIRSVRENKKE
jgi:transcriptional regulator NrdR